MTNATNPTDAYRIAGLDEDEIRAVTDVAAEVGSADPFAYAVAVPLGAVRTVLAIIEGMVGEAVSASESLGPDDIPPGARGTRRD